MNHFTEQDYIVSDCFNSEVSMTCLHAMYAMPSHALMQVGEFNYNQTHQHIVSYLKTHYVYTCMIWASHFSFCLPYIKATGFFNGTRFYEIIQTRPFQLCRLPLHYAWDLHFHILRNWANSAACTPILLGSRLQRNTRSRSGRHSIHSGGGNAQPWRMFQIIYSTNGHAWSCRIVF